ncbi:MAG: N-acetylmuramoyl-L-alanine amidase [Clostridiaceae bacterium]|nr:N-acetylmuramoyl-L-alanine amidase [Clostridiaceae bacterium]
MKLVLDPGHGGKDPGALGRYSLEKDINLSIALKLGEKIAASGIQVILTRKGDQFVDLQSRCDMANQNKADYFISIHCNGAGDPNAHGTETYCYGTSGKAYPLAQVVQKQMVEFIRSADRGVKIASFHVLRYTNMPAILLEIMFITNPREEEILNNIQWQDDFTTHMAKALCNYFGYKFAYSDKTDKHYAEDYYKAWKEKGIILNEHDLDSPLTWGEYIITQQRLKEME